MTAAPLAPLPSILGPIPSSHPAERPVTRPGAARSSRTPSLQATVGGAASEVTTPTAASTKGGRSSDGSGVGVTAARSGLDAHDVGKTETDSAQLEK